MKAVAFVPIRLNSKRVVGKNLKMLGEKPLLQYILETLVKVKGLSDIYVYCSQESIIPYLDDLSDVAREVGAVNCVEVRNGKLIGHNTDVTGIEASLHWLEADEGCKALVLGTGGASNRG